MDIINRLVYKNITVSLVDEIHDAVDYSIERKVSRYLYEINDLYPQGNLISIIQESAQERANRGNNEKETQE